VSHPERTRDCLVHIQQAARRAMRYADRVADAAGLARDDLTQDAVVRNPEIIGVAAARIVNDDPAFIAAHPDLPWAAMRGMRNKMIHEYFNVDWEIVWRTVKLDIPLLESRITELLVPPG
jgi:uncharacterized protein with HEPN domain